MEVVNLVIFYMVFGMGYVIFSIGIVVYIFECYINFNVLVKVVDLVLYEVKVKGCN